MEENASDAACIDWKLGFNGNLLAVLDEAFQVAANGILDSLRRNERMGHRGFIIGHGGALSNCALRDASGALDRAEVAWRKRPMAVVTVKRGGGSGLFFFQDAG